MQKFGDIVGFDRLKVVHTNDSAKPLGSKADRHAHIGEGEIGLEAFRLLVNDPRLNGNPYILETPDAETMHAVNLRRLKDLVAD
jgi:deoxyribonuclease-4